LEFGVQHVILGAIPYPQLLEDLRERVWNPTSHEVPVEVWVYFLLTRCSVQGVRAVVSLNEEWELILRAAHFEVGMWLVEELCPVLFGSSCYHWSPPWGSQIPPENELSSPVCRSLDGGISTYQQWTSYMRLLFQTFTGEWNSLQVHSFIV
jgi:hypothetical protein